MRKVTAHSFIPALCWIAVVSTSLLSIESSFAQPFAWKDANGKVIYGDNPPAKAKDLRDLSRPVDQDYSLPTMPVKVIGYATDKKRVSSVPVVSKPVIQNDRAAASNAQPIVVMPYTKP